MFDNFKRRVRFNQYAKVLCEPLNPISALSILTIAHIDPKINGYKADLTNSSLVTSIDTIAFLAFMSNLMISQASVGREKEKWFAKYYLDYMSKLGAFIFTVPAANIANYTLNRLVYLEDIYVSSQNLEVLVDEYANLLHRDSIRKKYIPIESGAQLTFSAIEHAQYHIEATGLLPYFQSAIKPSIPDVIIFLQSI